MNILGKYFLIVILISNIAIPLWKGKIPKPDETVIIYAYETTNVSFSMLSFQNLSKEKELDVYENEMGIMLGKLLQSYRTLEKDIRTKPEIVFVNKDKYQQFIFPFSITNSEYLTNQNETYESIKTNDFLSNENSSISNLQNLPSLISNIISNRISLNTNDILATITNITSTNATNLIALTNILTNNVTTTNTNDALVDKNITVKSNENAENLITYSNYIFYLTNDMSNTMLAYIETNHSKAEYAFYIKKAIPFILMGILLKKKTKNI